MILSSSSGAKIIYPDQKLEPIGTGTKIKGTLKTFAKGAAFTIVSAFIPVLHFVLVPIGVIMTAVITLMAYKKNYSLKDFDVHCPHCDEKSKIDVSGPDLPLRTFCPRCRHMIYLNN